MAEQPFVPKPEPEDDIDTEEWNEPDTEPKALPEPKEDELEPLRRERKIKAAMAFLKDALKDGPRPAAEVEKEGLEAGHAHATLALARKRAYIRSERKGQQWIWSTAAQRKEAARNQR